MFKLDELEEWSENNSDVSPDSQPTPLYHLYDVVKDKVPNLYLLKIIYLVEGAKYCEKQ